MPLLTVTLLPLYLESILILRFITAAKLLLPLLFEFIALFAWKLPFGVAMVKADFPTCFAIGFVDCC